MEETLEFDGKKYISSKRAARLVGYTKDYVGQLARGGKIEARLVGRSWYVAEDSIRAHKLEVHYTLTQPIKPRKNESTDAVVDVVAAVPEQPVRIHVADEPVKPLGTSEVLVSRKEPVAPVMPALQKAVAYTKPLRDPLVQADIQYEKGGPVFYEDDRPVLPEPHKENRFQGEPIPRPRPAQQAPRPKYAAHPSAIGPKYNVSRLDGIVREEARSSKQYDDPRNRGRSMPPVAQRPARARQPVKRPNPVASSVWVALLGATCVGSAYFFSELIDTEALFRALGL